MSELLRISGGARNQETADPSTYAPFRHGGPNTGVLKVLLHERARCQKPNAAGLMAVRTYGRRAYVRVRTAVRTYVRTYNIGIFFWVQQHHPHRSPYVDMYVGHLVGMSSKWLHGINWLGLSVSTVFYTNIEIIMTISTMLL